MILPENIKLSFQIPNNREGRCWIGEFSLLIKLLCLGVRNNWNVPVPGISQDFLHFLGGLKM